MIYSGGAAGHYPPVRDTPYYSSTSIVLFFKLFLSAENKQDLVGIR